MDHGQACLAHLEVRGCTGPTGARVRGPLLAGGHVYIAPDEQRLADESRCLLVAHSER